MTNRQIRAAIRAEQAKIDAAYWSFTRTARGKPPCLVVPEAYARRNELRAMLADRAKRRA